MDGVVRAAVCFLYFAGIAACRLPPAGNLPAASSPAPDFELPDADGKPHRLSQHHGRGPVVLVFYRGHW